MSRLEPWIIEQLENEERRRQDDEASRRHRIELPQTSPRAPAEHAEPLGGAHGVTVLPLSPGSDRIDVNIIGV